MNTGVRSVPLGRFRGIPVGAHWSALVAMMIIGQAVAVSVLPMAAPGHSPVAYWIAGVVTALAFMSSLLGHELAHALTARRFGIGVRRIDLWLLGGASQLSSTPPGPRADFLIALAGPATSLAIGTLAGAAGMALGAWGAPALVVSPVLWLAIANGLLAVFNLVPAAPLDGGRVLRAAIWWRTGDQERGEKAAAVAGRVFGLALGAFGFTRLVAGQLAGMWLVLMGTFLAFSSGAEQSFNQMRQRLGDVLVRDVMRRDPPIAPGWWTVRAFLHGLTSHERVFPVVSFEGTAIGLVSLGELVRVRDPLNTRVSEACRALADVPVASPAEPVLDVVTRTSLVRGGDVVLVLDDDRVAGVLGPDDFAWAVELAAAVPLAHRETAS